MQEEKKFLKINFEEINQLQIFIKVKKFMLFSIQKITNCYSQSIS